jgi:DNA/RNA endonuclease YhcR with UshA esterase domain
MKKEKIFFIISIILIFLLLLYTKELSKQEITLKGNISKINLYVGRAVIFVNETEGVFFTKNPFNLDLKKGDFIEIQGKQEVYKNKTSIIVNKIIK